MTKKLLENKQSKNKDLKVAIVCDWLVGLGGAERVTLELHKMFPDAPIYTSQYDPKKIDLFKDADIRTLWLQKLPKAFRKFLPVLRGWSFGRLDLSEYDLVISSSGAEAKAVKTGDSTVHITYCHSPTHYYWSRYEQYMAHPGFGVLNPLARLGLKLFARPMRRWDWRAAQKPDYFISNSNHTKAQIKKYYGRDSVVIHPPVDIERFKPRGKQVARHGLLIAGRQTPYKRFDLAVSACTQIGIPLKVIGDGPDHRKLVSMAGPRVTFLTKIPDDQMAWHFQHAEGFLFPGMDDFGIVAVEALAAGTPVIAYKAGGALDYIKPGRNGVFLKRQNVESLVEAIESFEQSEFNIQSMVATAKKFTPEKFQKKTGSFLEKVLTVK